jgi:Arc/MetJ family transcription regulator
MRIEVAMKRKNLIIDEALLANAKRLLKADTESATVNQALEEVVRILKIRDLSSFFGSDVWDGDLATMREDQPKRSSKRRRA